MRPGDNCWKNWAIGLRIRMMRQRVAEVTLPVDQIYEEVGSGGPPEDLRTYSYWNSCRWHGPYWETLFKREFEVEFELSPQGKVDEVTFPLDESWRSLMERR